MFAQVKEDKLRKRHFRLRKKISGSPERPRLSLHRSHLHLQAQVIDDTADKTLYSSSTAQQKAGSKKWGSVEGAKQFAGIVAEGLKKKSITKIVFDRGGRPYHGRIKIFADALRENGIQF